MELTNSQVLKLLIAAPSYDLFRQQFTSLADQPDNAVDAWRSAIVYGWLQRVFNQHPKQAEFIFHMVGLNAHVPFKAASGHGAYLAIVCLRSDIANGYYEPKPITGTLIAGFKFVMDSIPIPQRLTPIFGAVVSGKVSAFDYLENICALECQRREPFNFCVPPDLDETHLVWRWQDNDLDEKAQAAAITTADALSRISASND